MNLNDLLLSLTVLVGLFFTIPALAADGGDGGDGGDGADGGAVDADGDGVPDK